MEFDLVALIPWLDCAWYAVTFYSTQIYRCVKEKTAKGVAIMPWISQALANVVWAIWGTRYANADYVVVCSLGALMSFITMCVVISYRLTDKRNANAKTSDDVATDQV